MAEVFVLVLILRSGIALDQDAYPTIEACAQAARLRLATAVSEYEYRCDRRTVRKPLTR